MGESELTRAQVQEKLEQNKAFLMSRFHVVKIGLFGSFVEGDETLASDIDILVEFKKGHKDFFNFFRLKQYLENLFGRETDLVPNNAVKPHLRDYILNQVQYV